MKLRMKSVGEVESFEKMVNVTVTMKEMDFLNFQRVDSKYVLDGTSPKSTSVGIGIDRCVILFRFFRIY
jgi:hypothetical protein